MALTRTPEDQAAYLNEFFASRVPGRLGVVFERCSTEEVVGRMDVTAMLIAGTGFLFAPAVIALADTLAAGGTGANVAEDESFTTIELKANFLGTVREGTIACVATAVHLGKTTQIWDAVVADGTRGRRIALFRCTQLILWP